MTFFRSKRCIYMLCTVAFMLIDWTRGSQVGSTWAWTVNMLGIVIGLMVVLTDGLEHYFKIKYGICTMFFVCLLPISYLWWQHNQEFIYRDKLLTAVANVWIISVCLLRLLENCTLLVEKLKRLSTLEITGALLLVFMFLSRNEDVWPIWFLALFLVVYLSGEKEVDTRIFVNGIVDGIMVGFFIIQGFAFVFRPFDNEHFRYCGLYSNPNMNALFYCIVCLSFLIRLYQLRKDRKPLWERVICFLFSGAVAGFTVLTISKTAWVSLFCCFVLYVVVLDIKQLKLKAKQVIARIILFLLVVTLCVPITYLPVRYLPPLFHHPIWYEGEYAEWKVHSWDPIDSDKYVSFSEMMGAISGRFKPVFEKLFSKEVVGTATVHAQVEMDPRGIRIGNYFFEFDDEETLKYSSYLGRAATWYYYLFNGTLSGHSNQEGHYTGIGTSYNWHAQNAFLQIWYYYGIPAGLLFLFTIWGTWGKSLVQAWKNDDAKMDGTIIVMIYMTLFIIFGLFEAVWYPGQMILSLAVFAPRLMK